jgi:hypothetical protein
MFKNKIGFFLPKRKTHKIVNFSIICKGLIPSYFPMVSPITGALALCRQRIYFPSNHGNGTGCGGHKNGMCGSARTLAGKLNMSNRHAKQKLFLTGAVKGPAISRALRMNWTVLTTRISNTRKAHRIVIRTPEGKRRLVRRKTR